MKRYIPPGDWLFLMFLTASAMAALAMLGVFTAHPGPESEAMQVIIRSLRSP